MDFHIFWVSKLSNSTSQDNNDLLFCLVTCPSFPLWRGRTCPDWPDGNLRWRQSCRRRLPRSWIPGKYDGSPRFCPYETTSACAYGHQKSEKLKIYPGLYLSHVLYLSLYMYITFSISQVGMFLTAPNVIFGSSKRSSKVLGCSSTSSPWLLPWPVPPNIAKRLTE